MFAGEHRVVTKELTRLTDVAMIKARSQHCDFVPGLISIDTG